MEAISLTVPYQKVGSILGQGGSRVASIRTDANCDVRVQQAGQGITMRRIDITNKEPGISGAGALKMILDAIAETGDMETGEINLQLIISGFHAGCIIGPQGQTINGLRTTHPTIQLHIEKQVENCPERIVNFVGGVMDVCPAIMNVVQILEDGLRDGAITMPNKDRGMKRPRTSTNNFDNNSNMGMGGNNMPAAKKPFNMNNNNNNMMRNNTPRSGGGSGGTSRIEGEATFTVPYEQAGRIIGKGGKNIAYIRNQCGCKLDMEPMEQGSDVRILRIAGNMSSIEEACRLMQPMLDEDLNL